MRHENTDCGIFLVFKFVQHFPLGVVQGDKVGYSMNEHGEGGGWLFRGGGNGRESSFATPSLVQHDLALSLLHQSEGPTCMHIRCHLAMCRDLLGPSLDPP